MFFSATDVQTQKTLQQFSPLIVGMVVDAETGSVGYYRINPQTNQPIRIPDDKIKVYEEPSEAIPIPPQTSISYERTPVPPTPVVEVRRAPSSSTLVSAKLPTRTILFAAIVVALVVSAALLGAWLYRGSTAPNLSINHTPIISATIGMPVIVTANVTGAQIVRLIYTVASSTTPTVVNMTPGTSNAYSFTIPGTQVTSNIVYHIEAADSSGNTVQSNTYQIETADFQLLTSNSALTVYRSQSVTSRLSILTVNGFSEPVTLNTQGCPSGVLVAFSQNPVPAGVNSVAMNIIATTQAANGAFTFNLTASFSPPNATSILRQTPLVVTVADFGIALPSTIALSRGSTATLPVNLTITPGFMDRITLGLQGLPSGVTATFSASGSTLEIGPGTTTISLYITTANSVKQGTYTLTITASGDGITHYQIVQLTVR